MWAEFIHHLSLHFPIVLALVLAGIGVWSWRSETPELRTLMRIIGWGAFAFTTVAVISGILAAPGWFGGDGSARLSHHRNLGVTVWFTALIAALGYEYGHRHDMSDWRKFAAGVWCVVAFGVIGTGHWGGSEEHTDSVPWLADEATEERPAHPAEE
ncbi:MAG: hypothetical protein ACQEVA_12460 [Myxococcota bacterium]